MSLVTNVFRRGAVFHFRTRVPARLAELVGRKELWRSLRTTDPREARQRASRAILLTDALWRDLERLMSSRVPTRSELKARIDQWLKAELERDECLRRESEPDREGTWWPAAILERGEDGTLTVIERLESADLHAFDSGSEAERSARLGRGRQIVRGFNDVAHERGVRHELHGDAIARHREADTSVARRVLDDLLDKLGIDLPKDGDAYDTAARMMLAAQKDLADATERRTLIGLHRDAPSPTGWRPDLDDDPANDILGRLRRDQTGQVIHLVPTAQASDAASDVQWKSRHPAEGRAALRLSEAGEEAIAALAVSGGWRPGRLEDYAHAVRTFIDWHGSDPILGDITASLAGDFQVALGGYPSNAMKRRPYRDLTTFRERLAACKTNKDTAILSPISINGKYLTPLRAILSWQAKAGSGLENPFTKIQATVSRKVDAKTKRRDFTTGELQRFFNLPVFTGASREHGSGTAKPGDLLIRDWRYWVPLICVFSGMRLNEACGLALADLKQEDGIPFFHVRDEHEGQRLKGSASRRKVPLHPTLVGLGLVDQVEAWRSAGRGRLFDELAPDRRGYFSGSPSKLFNRWVKKIAEPDPDDPGELVFYSTRHTVITRLRAADVRMDVAMEIVGHELGDVHAGYGKVDVPTLKAAIDKIQYPGLDLFRLHAVEARA